MVMRGEPFVAKFDEIDDAVPVDDPQYPNSRAYRCGGVTIVLDDRDDVVQTVVREVRE